MCPRVCLQGGRRTIWSVRIENWFEGLPEDILALCKRNFEGGTGDRGGRRRSPVEVEGADED